MKKILLGVAVSFLLFITTFLFCITTFASEEECVTWKQVRIISTEHEQTGTIVFEAETDGTAYKSVAITVFGKNFEVKSEDLAKLKGFPLNSLIIAHEAGYPRLGGYTVHFKLKRIYYKAKKLVEERVRVSINKGKGLEVHGPEAKMIHAPK
ncbi:MAG: hypothetical protein JSV93_02645 [Candidatus Omnitrophota bacterium]|nr:MAG: hypothetical protein JSV93_02645 [Candidatus Omnitrophota bacterium]